MTLDDIAKIPRDFLTPKQVAPYLHMCPYSISLTARDCPDRLPFPFIRSGNRTKIPKRPFLEAFGWKEAQVSAAKK